MTMTNNNLDSEDKNLYDDDDLLDFEDSNEPDKQILEDPLKSTEFNEQDNVESDTSEVTDDLLTSYLKGKGIDPKSIKFTNEKGETEEVNFDSLSREEQLEILDYSNTLENDLRDDEIQLLNSLRSNNLTIQEYLDAIKQKGVQEYINNINEDVSYDVDNYTDEELFILDKKARIPDLSDEDAQQALENAKSNPDLFAKEISGLRKEYKQIEQQKLEQEQHRLQEESEAKAKEFEEVITNAIVENSELDFGDTVLAMSEDDMQEVASFILDSDAAGVRYIEKALSDPKTLVRMAWYALKGQEAINQISDYYKAEIKKVAQYNYEKGLSEARNGNITKSSTRVSKEQPIRKETSKKELSVDDLYTEDF